MKANLLQRARDAVIGGCVLFAEAINLAYPAQSRLVWAFFSLAAGYVYVKALVHVLAWAGLATTGTYQTDLAGAMAGPAGAAYLFVIGALAVAAAAGKMLAFARGATGSVGMWLYFLAGLACVSLLALEYLVDSSGGLVVALCWAWTWNVAATFTNRWEDGRQVLVEVERDSREERGGEVSSVPVLKPRLRFVDLHGMADLKRELRQFGQRFAGYKDYKWKVSDINGLLLGGPPGNGKTAFAEALAGELGFNFIKVGVQDLTSRWVNDSANKVSAVFAAARAAQPAVLFLDEFDAVARDRAEMGAGGGAAEDSKIVNTLLQEIDNIRRERVVLVAATNFVDRLDAAIARPGRFDVKIDVPYPDLDARKGILSGLLAKHQIYFKPGDLEKIAQVWERRSVAFIEAVAKRVRDDLRPSKPTYVTVQDLKQAARAASRRESNIPKTGVGLSQLTLPAEVRAEAESLVYRLKNWESIASHGGTPPSGVLLYGPPGTGKTNLVRAIAIELGDWHVFEVKTAEIMADPKKFERVIELASEHRPAFVFLDEADEILRDRSYSHAASATNEILKAMDGMMGRVPEVCFVAATNNADAIDAAAKRGGRFAEKIFMDLLRGEDLRAFIQAELNGRPQVRFAEGVSVDWLVRQCHAIAPADFVAVLNKSINYTLANGEPREVTEQDFLRAMAAILG